MANLYADALEEFQPKGRLVVGGYCVGALVALEVARILRARGREVGPLIVIDGAPENTTGPVSHWNPRYWMELARNIPGWLSDGDLMRKWSFRSLIWSLSTNFRAIARGLIGLKRGENLGGSYEMDGVMDLSNFPPPHRLFINRLFNALFAYVPEKYSEPIVVFEAKIAPLLVVPQIGRTWRAFAPQAEVVSVTGTHISMMREPFVGALADDICERVVAFAGTDKVVT